MDTEIELKILVPADANQIIVSSYLPTLQANIEHKSLTLYNSYYDTADNALRKLDMGFRVRGCNGEFEQTIKTAGQSVAGLHQRPEYNVNLPDNQPQLHLFDPALWPGDMNVEQLQEELEVVFTTHFQREAYLIGFENGNQIELVFDLGKVSAGSHEQSICEIELELKAGDAQCLFDIAEQLFQLMPCRLGFQSKAARGYMLAKGLELNPLDNSKSVNLSQQDNVEQAFIKSVSFVLNWWQHHEQCYVSTKNEAALLGIQTAIRMLGQVLRMYQPLLGLSELQSLIHKSDAIEKKWQWVTEFYGLVTLSSERGSFRKLHEKNDQLLSFLNGRAQGMLLSHQPMCLIDNENAARLQLALLKLLTSKPWLQTSDQWHQPIKAVCRQVLSDGLYQVSQLMTGGSPFDAEQYKESEALLRNVLFNGVFFANLFADNGREQFRAPWLDILDGIEELQMLSQLQHEIRRSDLEEKDELVTWVQDKTARLLSIMEQSRGAALDMQPYWED
ncbi:inorganic triphosphatase [Neptunicella marina]|uniref:CYTH domain-containing protein n=1 Tax=Neptunicella marina TaxID=2125989 RepID=A0A8J6IVM7_9ALTE|nr:CYTH domain-containing protein [Neptunicella marina]MBC3766303.1 CYTH domain-containing protein [Neptunicella marina]